MRVVVAPVERGLVGRAGVEARRDAAGAAVRAAAARTGRAAFEPRADAGGAPLASAGLYWSRSHADGLAVGAVSRAPLGVDVEWLGRRRLAAVAESLRPEERAQLKALDALRLLRAWTAKEAVVKRFGVGVAGLPRTRITGIGRYGRVELVYGDAPVVVRQDLVGDHVVSVCADEDAALEVEELRA